jgi:hypothetical protein
MAGSYASCHGERSAAILVFGGNCFVAHAPRHDSQSLTSRHCQKIGTLTCHPEPREGSHGQILLSCGSISLEDYLDSLAGNLTEPLMSGRDADVKPQIEIVDT